MKLVKDVMCDKPKHCEKNESLKKVVNEMSKSNIGSLPVVDKDQKVVGMVTDRDICMGLARTDKPLSELKVEEVMSSRVYTCMLEHSVDNALRLMRVEKVGRLPVVDKEGCLKGILSLNGIMRHHYKNNEKVEEQYVGRENVMNTLHSIAERNHKHTLEQVE